MSSVKRFSYSGDPSKSTLDAVRFTVGDTTKATALWDDREILYQISRTPNPLIASADLMLSKAAEFARKGDIKVGDISKTFTRASEGMKKCADALREQALRSAKPFFGGLTKSGKQALAGDTDAVQSSFFIGQTDDPTAVQLSEDLALLGGF